MSKSFQNPLHLYRCFHLVWILTTYSSSDRQGRNKNVLHNDVRISGTSEQKADIHGHSRQISLLTPRPHHLSFRALGGKGKTEPCPNLERGKEEGSETWREFGYGGGWWGCWSSITAPWCASQATSTQPCSCVYLSGREGGQTHRPWQTHTENTGQVTMLG